MGHEHVLKCACKQNEAGLRGWSYDVLVSDTTGFFESAAPSNHRLGWDVFVGVDQRARMIPAEEVLAWINGLRKALEDHRRSVPAIHWISRGGNDEVAYLEIEGSYWMVEAVHDDLIAGPIDARTVKDRVLDDCYRAVIVHGSRVDFPGADPIHPVKFRPTVQQVTALLADSELDFLSEPIGVMFAAEIAAINALAEHAVREQESVDSFCV